jgi:bromodomain-containing factor 1
LDIDQLSNEALLRLWELCKKALPSFAKDSAPATSTEVSRSAKQAAAAAKSAGSKKKNKPMNAQEQEARIAHLRSLSQIYNPKPQAGDDTAMTQITPGAESSDDSDSEEE